MVIMCAKQGISKVARGRSRLWLCPQTAIWRKQDSPRVGLSGKGRLAVCTKFFRQPILR